ncbi:DNA helicase rad5 [Epichloe bromicola]|uniref:DNA helicase rad5 n=1 Tax=Epichloe bromicola TaxID=79588 RepID=A0ABQ0CTP4_9HYPO
MPKKAAKRRPLKAATLSSLEVAIDGCIPSTLSEYFATLPSENGHGASADVDPSPKRRKVKSEPLLPICVAKGDIQFTRRVLERDCAAFAKSCGDVGELMKVTLPQPGQLLISSRPKAPVGFLSVIFALRPDELDEKSALILNVGGTNNKRDGTGDIWIGAALTMTCRDGLITFDISLQLNWNETPSPYYSLPNSNERKITSHLIDCFWPNADHENESAWSPTHFYEAAHVPSKVEKVPDIVVPGLESTLFPYQKRTLQWLLAREGVMWSQEEARLQALSSKSRSTSIDSFRTVRDASGNAVFVSDVFQTVTRDPLPYQRADEHVKGGILAEEMGLGKTLEVLGLILLHSRTNVQTEHNGHGTDRLVPTRATLIVTPESLRQQWITEIARHAPSLRVKHYQGCKKIRDGDETEIVEELCEYDVVITTYSVLSAELHYALEPPQRSRRFERAYHRATSPLVKISWWRLCLDEAQMIENGFSQAAFVARVLPRTNAWGITGTPVKDDVNDLFGLLLFLRYEPYCSASQVWQSLITQHKRLFQQIFNSIALRHTKSLVRDEILLPPQKRYVISMPFTAVEEQHYQSLFKDMAEECGLDVDGTPKTDDWDPENYEDVMRIWLNRLRQTTLHPEVGIYSRRLLGYNKARPMRTVEEVLTAMLEQSENALRTEERAYLLTRLTRGQLYENSPRVKEAMILWEDVKKDTERLVSDARIKLKDAIREHGGEEAVKRAEEAEEEEKEKICDLSETDDEEPDESETKGKVGECRRRLRSALELHHRAVFFCANAAFQVKDNQEMTEPDSEEFQRLKKLEDEGYTSAKVLRQEILRESNRKATRFMNKIRRMASKQAFTEIPELVIKPQKGIESGRIVDNLEVLYGELNEQANVVDEWREEIVQLLLRPLVDEDEDEVEVEITGEELGDSAKFQDLLMVYVTTLRAAIADRQDAISGQTNELAKHETETSLKLAKAGNGPAPEKMAAMLKLRAEIKPKMANLSMRAAVAEFRALQSRMSRDAAPGGREAVESKIASDQLRSIQAQINEQTKAALALESEIEGFKATMNARLEYYRQLQAVSDAVLPHDGPKIDAAVAKLQHTEDELRKKLSSAEAKHRYLVNLKEAGSKSNEPRMCVICQMPFVIGVLTVCGHQFCKECMALWFRAHHNCPLCKRGLKPSNLHDIAIKPQQLQVRSEAAGDQSHRVQRRETNSPKKTAIYSEFNADKLAEIKNIDLDGPSFTTKVDTLVRHLLWLRESDPGAKSIVFSQYRDFLHILRNAFRRFRIGYASIDDSNGIASFKEDAAVEVFLLHARAHSSGLNLVNASHVFLTEPLLNTALELQAIARVDRIGQQHETTVWLYLVSGTVEESVYNLSVQRRTEHMGRRNRDSNGASAKGATAPEVLDASIEAANTLELEHAALSKLMSKDRTAGEMVAKGDLWECLFGSAGSVENANEGHRDARIQEKAVLSYLAGEAAEARRA